MSQFELDKNESAIQIVDKSDEGGESYLVIEVRNMTLNFDMKFDLHSVPEWLRDKGTGFIRIQNFNISLHLTPFTRHGKVQFHFKDAVIEIEDFYAQMNGTSEISKAFELVINKFKEFFKNEIVNIFARKISKSLERSLNNRISSDKSLSKVGRSGGVYLNSTLTGDPIILGNFLSLPFDGSSYSLDDNGDPVKYSLAPVNVSDSANATSDNSTIETENNSTDSTNMPYFQPDGK